MAVPLTGLRLPYVQIARPEDPMTSDNAQSNVTLVDSLPRRLSEFVSATKDEFDSGVNSEMSGALTFRIEAIRTLWVELANRFSTNVFGSVPLVVYFDGLLYGRIGFYRSISEPFGPGSGGTNAPIIVGVLLLSEAKHIVQITARALLPLDMAESFWDDWTQRWEAAE